MVRAVAPVSTRSAGFAEQPDCDGCVVTLFGDQDVSTAASHFTVLGAQFDVERTHAFQGTAAQIEWSDTVLRIDAGDQSESILLEELSRLYAARIAGPDMDRASLELALRNPLPLNQGADSHAIWSLSTAEPTVLKIGAPEVIRLETKFFDMACAVSPDMFPKVWSRGQFGDRAWYLMEAGEPDSGEGLVFANSFHSHLNDNWESTLTAELTSLATLYRQTLVQRPCAVADYHYRRRISRILNRADFRATAAKIGGVGDMENLLERHLVINGMVLPPVDTLVDAANRKAEMSLPKWSTMIHGDLHLKNMVASNRTSGCLLLDPRLQWDDEPVDRFAYGDPVYDMSTLLHSVGGMATILKAIELDATADLITIDATDDEISVTFAPDVLELIESTANRFPVVCERLLPPETLNDNLRSRLFIGAANATIGWLKYQAAVPTRSAWWAVYALTAMYLCAATGKGMRDA